MYRTVNWLIDLHGFNMVPCNLVNTGSGNGMLPYGTKPLPEVILTYHHLCPVHCCGSDFAENFRQILTGVGLLLAWSLGIHVTENPMGSLWTFTWRSNGTLKLENYFYGGTFHLICMRPLNIHIPHGEGLGPLTKSVYRTKSPAKCVCKCTPHLPLANVLTHWGLVMHMCNSDLGQHWFQ